MKVKREKRDVLSNLLLHSLNNDTSLFLINGARIDGGRDEGRRLKFDIRSKISSFLERVGHTPAHTTGLIYTRLPRATHVAQSLLANKLLDNYPAHPPGVF